jgi:L-lactate dehydrogenase complex protein LldF
MNMNVHRPTSDKFNANAHEALANEDLQTALRTARVGFVSKRAKARAQVPEFDDMRDGARDLKDHVLANLDLYLEEYERKVIASGGVVHWAETAEDARRIVLDICRKAGAKTVNKGKTMISEECGINEHLIDNGIAAVETDLGEYIIQLRGEMPSHIIGPAVHVTVPQVRDAFIKAHPHLPADRDLSGLDTLLSEARTVLREKYFEAEVGITGANMLIAETGQSVIVTNEGNGDLSQSLPKVHIVMASLEKIVPTLEDASTVLRVLARSATGQEMSVYTTFSKGPRRAEDQDGPEEYHVVLLDNGRSGMVGSDFQDMLRCIRCGACMNHCPVYQAVGGHAYGWVYPGPMGAVLTPSLIGVEKGGHLPNASTFCGRCADVCPMRIPLPKMMRSWREREFEKNLQPGAARVGLGLWAALAKNPMVYRLAIRGARMGMGLFMRRGKAKSLPLASGWTDSRDFPAPEPGGSFMDRWNKGQRA